MVKKTILRGLYVLTILVIVASCRPYMHQPLTTSRAKLGPESPNRQELMFFPKPQEKIVTAVYKFRDQTGQYKPSENGANWSTAVTQGATTILIRVLEESGWFIPIERENMANLLNERKIIRTSRAQYEGTDQNNESMLPPLLFAGIILEGGIISYESNIVTGGAGIRYFGADISGQYREDRISIYIRAVSTANGKVLKTVYTTKSILSQEVSLGLFRYVSSKRLLEAETGFTYNEPIEICVTEAIEKAVESLIIEGVNDNLWKLQNPADTTSVAFVKYKEEKKQSYESNPMGYKNYLNNRGQVSLGISIGSNYYSGDFSNSLLRPKSSVLIGVAINPYLSINTELGYRGLSVKDKVDDYSFYGDVDFRYILLPFDKFTPFVTLGGGCDYNNKNVGLSNYKFLPKVNGSLGLEYMLNENLGLSLSSGINYYLSDKFDNKNVGKYNDFSWNISLGLNIYFNKNKKNK